MLLGHILSLVSLVLHAALVGSDKAARVWRMLSPTQHPAQTRTLGASLLQLQEMWALFSTRNLQGEAPPRMWHPPIPQG